MKNTAAFKESAKAGIIGGGMGGLMSWLANYYVIAVPETVFMSAMGNSISGLISGFLGGFLGVLAFIKLSRNSTA